jgi:RNA-directed DNA polymerase
LIVRVRHEVADVAVRRWQERADRTRCSASGIPWRRAFAATPTPYDPKWEPYFEERLFQKMRSSLAGQERIRYLWEQQQGRCPVCGQLLLDEEEKQVHHRTRRSCGGTDALDNLELFHANCHRQRHYQRFGTEPDRVSQEAF